VRTAVASSVLVMRKSIRLFAGSQRVCRAHSAAFSPEQCMNPEVRPLSRRCGRRRRRTAGRSAPPHCRASISPARANPSSHKRGWSARQRPAQHRLDAPGDRQAAEGRVSGRRGHGSESRPALKEAVPRGPDDRQEYGDDEDDAGPKPEGSHCLSIARGRQDPLNASSAPRLRSARPGQEARPACSGPIIF
jgi:hypothetical protein